MKYFVLCFTAILFSLNSVAQIDLRQAEKLYRANKFEEALPLYKEIVGKFPNTSTYQHRYAVCLVETKSDFELAEKHARFAYKKGIRLSLIPIAKSQYYRYQFSKAKENLSSFMKRQRAGTDEYREAEQLSEKCDEMIHLLERTEDVKITSSKIVPTKDFHKNYSLSTESGKIVDGSKYVQETPKAGLAFITERDDRIFYARSIIDTLDTDLYTKSRLIDTWEGETRLPNTINTEGNELYPFMLTDGTTLYFCSNGPGSIGGYDIFVTRYNPETRTFLPPRNLGFPYNSFGDDFLYAVDELKQVGWIASNRNNEEGMITIYNFTPNSTKQIIKGTHADMANAILMNDSAISVGNLAFATPSNNKPTTNANAIQSLTPKINEVISFVINDTLYYENKNQFVSETALSLFEEGQQNLAKVETLRSQITKNRNLYSLTNNSAKRKNLADEIFNWEEELLQLEETSEVPFINARKKELEVILQEKIKEGAKVTINNDPIFQPISYIKSENPSFINSDIAKNISTVFSSDQVEVLRQCEDSILYYNAVQKKMNALSTFFRKRKSTLNSPTSFWNEMRGFDKGFDINKSEKKLSSLAKQQSARYKVMSERYKIIKSDYIRDYLKAKSTNLQSVTKHYDLTEKMDNYEYYRKRAMKEIDKKAKQRYSDSSMVYIKAEINKAQNTLESGMLYFTEKQLAKVEEKKVAPVEQVIGKSKSTIARVETETSSFIDETIPPPSASVVEKKQSQIIEENPINQNSTETSNYVDETLPPPSTSVVVKEKPVIVESKPTISTTAPKPSITSDPLEKVIQSTDLFAEPTLAIKPKTATEEAFPEHIVKNNTPSSSSKPVTTNVSELKLHYKIQVGIYSRILPKKELENLDHVIKLKMGGSGLFKYYCGMYNDADFARREAKNLGKKTFPGAYVVPFYNGKPITFKQAAELK